MSGAQPSALVFEPLQEEHLDAVMAIEKEAYPEPWTRGMFLQDMDTPLARFYVAFIEGVLVGYVGIWRVADEAHMTSVTVRRDYRRQGLGSELVRFILHVSADLGLRRAFLEVRESNVAGQRLYRKLGFQHTGWRKGYYRSTGEDAVVMSKTIDPAGETC